MEPLVTPEEFAGYMQRDLDRYTADLVTRGASALVRGYCGWGISRADDTWTLNGTGTHVLPLPTLHLTDVPSVVVDGTAYTWGVDYTFDETGLLYRPSGWPVGVRNIVATVTHGYDPVPDDVRLVVCALAAKSYANPEGLTGKSSGDGSRSYAPLSDLEMALISNYRLG